MTANEPGGSPELGAAHVRETVSSRSEADTMAVGARLSHEWVPGDIVMLEGTLGAGKTTFVRGAAAAIGVDPEAVSSPTFTLLHEYRGGRIPVYHADLYRLGPGGAEDLGLDEVTRDGVLIVEWPDRLTHAPEHGWRIVIDWGSADDRRITITRTQTTRTTDHPPD